MFAISVQSWSNTDCGFQTRDPLRPAASLKVRIPWGACFTRRHSTDFCWFLVICGFLEQTQSKWSWCFPSLGINCLQRLHRPFHHELSCSSMRINNMQPRRLETFASLRSNSGSTSCLLGCRNDRCREGSLQLGYLTFFLMIKGGTHAVEIPNSSNSLGWRPFSVNYLGQRVLFCFVNRKREGNNFDVVSGGRRPCPSFCVPDKAQQVPACWYLLIVFLPWTWNQMLILVLRRYIITVALYNLREMKDAAIMNSMLPSSSLRQVFPPSPRPEALHQDFGPRASRVVTFCILKVDVDVLFWIHRPPYTPHLNE